MADNKGSASGVSWENFRWVAGSLVAVIALFLGLMYTGLRSDISELKVATEKNGLEIVKAVRAVEKQLAVTNAKLDGVVNELRLGRPK